MNICITGASGFVGKNLVAKLSKYGHSIFCVTRDTTSKSDIDFLTKLQNVQIEKISTAIEKSEIIFNLAGVIGSYSVSDEQYWQSNYNFTKKIISHCQNQKIIHLSTAGVYGPCHLANEDSAPNTTNTYERSKLAAEREVENYHNHIIIQAGWILGRFDTHSLPIFRLIQDQHFIKIGKGNCLVQPIAVTDLVHIMTKCLSAEIQNIKIIAAGEILSFNDLFKIIAKKLDRKNYPIYIPKTIALLSAAMLETLGKITQKKPIISVSGVHFFSQERTYNNQRIKTILGFTPKCPEKLIEETIHYYKTDSLL